MSALLDLLLGIVTGIGGFVEVGSISTSAQAGAEFGFQLLWAVAVAAAMLALVGLTVRSLQLGEWAAAALIVGFVVVFAVQIGNYFRRNRPGSYRPEAVPASVLPRL